MAFPTVFEAWISRALFGRRLLVYDGSASNASTPWVPQMLKRATPRGRVVFCESQAFCDEWMPGTVRVHGPLPRTFSKAFQLAATGDVESAFERAESFEGSRLPARVIMLLGGGLGSLARMGRFTDNIERYQRHFSSETVFVIDLEE